MCPTSPARQPIFRSLAPSGDHLLSASQAEGPGLGYSDEGVRFYDYASPCSWGLTPLLRIKNPKSGEHFYTTSPQERDTLVVSGWTDEGDIGCIAPSALCSSVELFRLVQMWHLYTVDVNERNTLVAAGWTQEWSPGFVWMSP